MQMKPVKNECMSFLVKSLLAESLFAGGFLALMIVVSQELVRFYRYGANYVPFRPGGGGPSLIDGL